MAASEYLNNKFLENAIADFKQSRQDKIKYEMMVEDLRNSVKNNNKVEDKLDEMKEQLDKVVVKYNESQNKLAISFLTLAENIIRFKKFHFVDVDEAIQEFVMICFDKLDRFDPNFVGKNGQKAKAFNYMTTCIFNHYRQMYRTARNYNEMKRKFQEHLQQKNDSFNVKTKGSVIKDKYTKI